MLILAQAEKIFRRDEFINYLKFLIMLRKSLFVAIVLMATFATYAQTQFPTPSLWLKSDALSDTIEYWQDFGKDSLRIPIQDNFVYSAREMNFNYCVNIDTNGQAFEVDYEFMDDTEITVFVVYQPDSIVSDYGIWQMKLDSLVSLQLSSFHIKDIDNMYEYTDTSGFHEAKVNLFRTKWTELGIDTTFSSINLLGSDSIPYCGKFGELLFYDENLSFAEIAKIYTYLSIKYGISITDKVYLNSDNQIIWSAYSNEGFKNNIAGIGRDSILFIDQKQSAANGGEAEVAISAGEFSSCNDSNDYHIVEHDFLIWSNNGNDVNFIENDTIENGIDTCFLERKWIMNRSGITANQIGTTVRFYYPNLSDTSMLFLIIDRMANDTLGSFINFETYFPDSISDDGFVFYNDIRWDVDSTGQDLFSFMKLSLVNNAVTNQNSNGQSNDAFNEKLFWDFAEDQSELVQNNYEDTSIFENGKNVEFKGIVAYPNPSNGEFSVKVNLNYPSSLEYYMFDQSGKLIKEALFEGSAKYEFIEKVNIKGCYNLLFRTISGKENVLKVIVK